MTSTSNPQRTAERTLLISQSDIDAFCAWSGDHNPIHTDPDYASSTDFGRTAAHGMFLFVVLRELAAQIAPQWALQSQELMFPAPALEGDMVTFRAEGQVDGKISVAATVEDPQKTVCVGTLVFGGDAR